MEIHVVLKLDNETIPFKVDQLKGTGGALLKIEKVSQAEESRLHSVSRNWGPISQQLTLLHPLTNPNLDRLVLIGAPPAFSAYLERPRSLKTWIYFLVRCLALCRRVSGIPRQVLVWESVGSVSKPKSNLCGGLSLSATRRLVVSALLLVVSNKNLAPRIPER